MNRPELSLADIDDPISGSGGGACIPQPVAMTDTDMSGSVTTEEFARAAARRFATQDANKNGLLEAGELRGAANPALRNRLFPFSRRPARASGASLRSSRVGNQAPALLTLAAEAFLWH